MSGVMGAIGVNERMEELDVLRGFALMGIILVNVGPLLAVDLPASHSWDAGYWRFLYLFVEGRFYSIFTFLFGVGLYLFISRAEAKGRNGYVLFLRRIFVLFLVGVLHTRFHPGEALTVYAVSSLILLPFYKVSRGINLLFGLLMLAVLSVFMVKILLVVPLMLLGIAAGQYQLFSQLSRHRQQVAMVSGILFVLSVAGIVYQDRYAPVTVASSIESGRFVAIGIMIGPIVSAFYVSVLLLLLQWPFFRRIAAPLKDYGRMAFTNYLLQTVFILIAGKELHLKGEIELGQTLYLCLIIYVIQLVFSTVWLRFFRFGPLEWGWRALTYGSLPPMRNQR